LGTKEIPTLNEGGSRVSMDLGIKQSLKRNKSNKNCVLVFQGNVKASSEGGGGKPWGTFAKVRMRIALKPQTKNRNEARHESDSSNNVL